MLPTNAIGACDDGGKVLVLGLVGEGWEAVEDSTGDDGLGL